MARLETEHARSAARSRAHHRRHDRRGTLVRMGRIPRHSRGPSRPRQTDAHLAGQSRRQCRRPRKPGAARPAVQPGENLAQDARSVRDRSLGADRLRVDERRRRRARPHACGGARAATPSDRDLRRPRRLSAVEPARAALGRIVPAHSSAGRGQTGSASSLLNSNADTNFSFTNALGMIPAGQAPPAHRRARPLSESAMDRRAASPSDRISDARRRLLRADRHGAYQRQLV